MGLLDPCVHGYIGLTCPRCRGVGAVAPRANPPRQPVIQRDGAPAESDEITAAQGGTLNLGRVLDKIDRRIQRDGGRARILDQHWEDYVEPPKPTGRV